MTTERLHRANASPIVDADILLLEFWEQGKKDDKLRVAINNEDVVSNGVTYPYGYVEVAAVSTDETAPSISISVSNVNRAAGRMGLAVERPIVVRMILVNSTDFDTVVADNHDMLILSNVSVSSQTVSGTLEPQLNPLEPTPNEGVNPDFFPGL